MIESVAVIEVATVVIEVYVMYDGFVGWVIVTATSGD